MSARLLVANLLSFGLQVTVLAAASAFLARAFRLDRSRQPRIVLACWRVLLFVCLALPFCQPWRTVAPPPVETVSLPMLTREPPAPDMSAPMSASRPKTWPVTTVAIAILATGISLRLLWLLVGAVSLRRLRRGAQPLDPLPASVHQAQVRLGVPAALLTSDRIAGPVTFGWRRPVVLFPPGLESMPPHVQEAITYHELLHVRRRDWLSELFEEAIRTLLWFHPAIWWLVGRIRLAREQVVDQAAVELTASKERYVDALLAVARANRRPMFVPVSPFFRRHLLKERVARILQESPMTTTRLLASLTASAAALTCAAVYAVSSFPLEAQGRALVTGHDVKQEPIQIVKGSEHLLHGATPGYPRRAIEQQVEGDVVVEMTLNDRGEVSDARVLSGPEELRRSALEAVLQWHYAPSALRSTDTQATLRFALPAGGADAIEVAKKTHSAETRDVAIKAKSMTFVPAGDGELNVKKLWEDLHAKQPSDEHVKELESPDKSRFDLELKERAGILEMKLIGKLDSLKPDFSAMPRLVDVTTERVAESIAAEVLAQAGVAVGDAIGEAAAKRIAEAASTLDEHVHVRFAREGDGVVLRLLTR